ncbi:MAG: NADPH-dependent oxidoreductase [Bacteroidetes bacterium GWF2_49_14]|nr:MAG: NADPH-dependent oxidoreductase [Bacteroidetes bacterium GWF2_49_14]HBB90249.1 NADPH-dependent oxidoreductase [Bacteroidales bacterium]
MSDTILNHRSIRKFEPRPLQPGMLDRILSAATRASTTGNMQVYSIIVTTDEEIRRQLWEAHFKQDMVLEAPVHLTFCADFNRFSSWCKLRNADPGYDNFLSFLTAAIDAVLASQNAALAAEEEGLGICYLGTATWMAARMIDILNLPKLVVPVASLVVGYPAENPPLTDRLPVDGVVHREVYKDYDEPGINHIYLEKESLPDTLELLKINQTETLAQIFTGKRYTRKDNRFFSRAFLEVLERQGFMINND